MGKCCTEVPIHSWNVSWHDPYRPVALSDATCKDCGVEIRWAWITGASWVGKCNCSWKLWKLRFNERKAVALGKGI